VNRHVKNGKWLQATWGSTNIGKSAPPQDILKSEEEVEFNGGHPVQCDDVPQSFLKEDEGERNRHRSHSDSTSFLFVLEKEKITPKMRGTLAKTYSIKTDNRQPVGSGNPQTPFRVKMRIIYSAVVKRPKTKYLPHKPHYRITMLSRWPNQKLYTTRREWACGQI